MEHHPRALHKMWMMLELALSSRRQHIPHEDAPMACSGSSVVAAIIAHPAATHPLCTDFSLPLTVHFGSHKDFTCLSNQRPTSRVRLSRPQALEPKPCTLAYAWNSMFCIRGITPTISAFPHRLCHTNPSGILRSSAYVANNTRAQHNCKLQVQPP